MSDLRYKFVVLAMFTKGALAPEAFICPEHYDTAAEAHGDARNLIEFEKAATVTVYTYPTNSKAKTTMEVVSRHSQEDPNLGPVIFGELEL
jgi:hypothetical protein